MVDARQIFAQASQVQVKSARPEWTQILLQPTIDARNMVMGYVRCEIADLSGELGEQLALAVDELLRNAIEHGKLMSEHFRLILFGPALVRGAV